MTEEEKRSKIEELRQKLANGRATGRTVEDADGHDTASDREDGAGLQAVFGQGEGLTGNIRQFGVDAGKPASHDSGARKVAFRERSSALGHGNDDRGTHGIGAETRTSGRLIAEDPIRPRIEKEEGIANAPTKAKARGARIKSGKATEQAGPIPPNTTKKQGWKIPSWGEIPGISKGKTLSSKEASDIREGFRTSLEDDFGYIDQWLRSKSGQVDLEVWSNVDNEELDKVTDVFLRGAQRSPVLATVVRETVNTHDYLIVAVVLLPRLQQTVSILREARQKNPRPARWQRTVAKRRPEMNGASA